MPFKADSFNLNINLNYDRHLNFAFLDKIIHSAKQTKSYTIALTNLILIVERLKLNTVSMYFLCNRDKRNSSNLTISSN